MPDINVNVLDIILVFLLAFILFSTFFRSGGNLTIVRAPDGLSYFVQDLPDKQDAAALLSRIHSRVSLLQAHLSRQDLKGMRYVADRLVYRYSHASLSENGDRNYTSYITRKRNISLCLRHRGGDNSGRLVDENTLMYVVVHELAHMCTDSVVTGHDHDTDPEFNAVFGLLREHAALCGAAGLDIPHGKPYCGVVIR